jgi:ABC-type multidrug transport system fused ATPase/permease subunit
MDWTRDLSAALGILCRGAGRYVAWRLSITAVLVVAGGLLAGVAPLALKEMVDVASGATAPGPTGASAWWPPLTGSMAWAIAYLGTLCGARLLAELRPPLMGAAEQRLYARLKRRYVRHLLALPLSFHLGRQSGTVADSLQQAITGYQLIVYHLVNSVLPVAVELVTVTLVLATVGPPVLLTTFAGTAIAYLAVLSFCTFRLNDGADAVCEASLDAHGMLTDSLINCEAIKCFSAERATGERYGAITTRLEDRWRHLNRARTRMGLALTATFAGAMAACLAVALHAMNQRTLSVGGLVLASVYLLQVVRPLEMLGGAARDLSQALAFIRPLLDVLDEAPEALRSHHRTDPNADLIAEGPAREQAMPSGHAIGDVDIQSATSRSTQTTNAERNTAQSSGPASISFFNVRFSYNEQKPVLDALTLDIAPGRTTAIVGASGCGKSSLVRLLLRLYQPQAGRILIDGVSIDALAADELRAMIGVVPQDTVLFNDTIAFNIGIGKPGALQQDIEQAVRLAGLHDLIHRLPDGYDTVVGERGLKVSGGERQRIAIARAVLKRPRIYVFDEATSMLDSTTEHAILQNLRAVSQGCTTITIAHRLSTIRHADAIVVLDHGQAVEQGDHATLLRQGGAYARLWQTQQAGTNAQDHGEAIPAPAPSRHGWRARRQVSRRRLA